MASTVSSVGQSANDLQSNFLKLLVTQLKNQSPLDPVDNNQMTAQLAQLSQLSQIEQLNTKFSDVVAASQKSYANSLIGRQITFTVTDASGNSQLYGGTVGGVITQGDDIKLQVGDYAVGLSDVLAVI
jgi:flagellar basal-body rod modification protein FlgD